MIKRLWQAEDVLVAQTFAELAPYNDRAKVRAVPEWRAKRLVGFGTKELWEMAKAEDPDAELFWVWKYDGHPEGDVFVGHVPHFSKNIEAAWQVVEALRSRGIYIDVRTLADFYEVIAVNHEGKELATEAHPSLPLAICRVALKAVGVALAVSA